MTDETPPLVLVSDERLEQVIGMAIGRDTKRCLLELRAIRRDQTFPQVEEAWNAVIDTCRQAWPDKQQLGYSQSPTELIVEIINERDEAIEKLAASAQPPGADADNAARYLWIVQNQPQAIALMLDAPCDDELRYEIDHQRATATK